MYNIIFSQGHDLSKLTKRYGGGGRTVQVS
jgi:hypothetical protein